MVLLSCSRLFAVLLAMAVISVPSARVDAALNETTVTPMPGRYELVIVEVENCTYCTVMRRDVMPAFNLSAQAKELPVRFLDLNTPEAAKLELVDGPVTVVPTVLLVKGNREVARAAGYMGPDGFFHAIKWMLDNAQ